MTTTHAAPPSGTAERPPARSTSVLLHAVLPALAGVAAALIVGADGGVAPVIMVCAAIYLAAAVIGRPWSAWVAFAASAPFMALSVIFDSPWPTLISLGAAQVVLLVIGLVRGTWRRPSNLAQLVAAVAFAGLAVLAAAGAPVIAAVTVVTGLVAHGVWDVIHHRARIVVSRSYSAFCAALDFALAAVVFVALATGA